MNSYLDVYMKILKNKGSCIGILQSGCSKCGEEMRAICGDLTDRTQPRRQARCQLALSKLLNSPYAGKVFEELL